MYVYHVSYTETYYQPLQLKNPGPHNFSPFQGKPVRSSRGEPVNPVEPTVDLKDTHLGDPSVPGLGF